MSGKRNSIFALILLELFFTCLLVIICTDIYRDMKTFRLNKLQSDSYLLGEWIRDSHTASGYLLKSIVSIVPPDQVYYPPRDPQVYSEERERLNLLRSSFPHAYLAGVIDDSGVLTHSLYHDGMDMTQYDFYTQLLDLTAGSYYFSDAFQIDDGVWVVCHALKTTAADRNIMAVMMIELEFFKDWLSRLELENADGIVVTDRKGYILAKSYGGTKEQGTGGLKSLLAEETGTEGVFRLVRDRENQRFALYRIEGLPYSVVFLNPEMISIPEILLPLIIIMIGYVCVEILGFVVFRSQISQINLNRELEKTSTEMTTIFENSMVGIIMLDEEFRLCRANNRFVEIIGHDSPDKVLGMHISGFHSSVESFEKFVQLYKQQMKRSGVVNLEYEFRRRDGSLVWARVVGKALNLMNEADSQKREIWIVEDITEQRAARQKLKEMAATDAMTGISNRRSFLEGGEREFDIYLRHKRPLTVVMLDIDHFKAVNDRYGHGLGDKAIILTVELCSRSLRSGDLFGRIGGEEFALVLPDTDAAAAFLVAERIRGMIEAETRSRDDGIPHFTVSMGIAEAGDESFELLLQRADQALYKAKESGRNRVCRS